MQETKVDVDAPPSVLDQEEVLSGRQKSEGEITVTDQSIVLTKLHSNTIKDEGSAQNEAYSGVATNEPVQLKGWRLVAVLFWYNISKPFRLSCPDIELSTDSVTVVFPLACSYRSSTLSLSRPPWSRYLQNLMISRKRIGLYWLTL